MMPTNLKLRQIKDNMQRGKHSPHGCQCLHLTRCHYHLQWFQQLSHQFPFVPKVDKCSRKTNIRLVCSRGDYTHRLIYLATRAGWHCYPRNDGQSRGSTILWTQGGVLFWSHNLIVLFGFLDLRLMSAVIIALIYCSAQVLRASPSPFSVGILWPIWLDLF